MKRKHLQRDPFRQLKFKAHTSSRSARWESRTGWMWNLRIPGECYGKSFESRSREKRNSASRPRGWIWFLCWLCNRSCWGGGGINYLIINWYAGALQSLSIKIVMAGAIAISLSITSRAWDGGKRWNLHFIILCRVEQSQKEISQIWVLVVCRATFLVDDVERWMYSIL